MNLPDSGRKVCHQKMLEIIDIKMYTGGYYYICVIDILGGHQY